VSAGCRTEPSAESPGDTSVPGSVAERDEGTTSTTLALLLDPEAVSLDGMQEHLAALQQIADANGGTRSVGSAGYQASVDYAVEQLEQAGYEVEVDRFAIPPEAAEYSPGVALPESSVNVIAESDRAPGDDVVMVGGHLDSVFTGPGINDNGSGVSAILELAEWLASEDGELEVDVRFALWGAEEVGLVGSASYVAALADDDEALNDIIAYINLDMIGSSNGGRFVYDPEEAADPFTTSARSDLVRDLFLEYYEEQQLPVLGVWTDGRSDEAPFATVGIPVGGLFSGAESLKTRREAELFGGTVGAPLAPCYHLACDSVADVDPVLMSQLAQGFATVTLRLAVQPELLGLRFGARGEPS
jgi:aminopeptidase S